MNQAIQGKNSNQIALLLGQGLKLLLDVDAGKVFLQGKNYTDWYLPVMDFGLQFLNGSGFLNGTAYTDLVTSVVTFNSSLFTFIEQLEIVKLNRTNQTAEQLAVYALADLFFEFYPVNQFTFGLKD